jgi:hypothetical protein
MPGKWNQYEDKADEGKSAVYTVRGRHDDEGDNPRFDKMEDSSPDSY